MYLKKELEQRKFDKQLNEDSLNRNQSRLKALTKSINDIEGNAKEREAIQNDLARF
jgi:predicted outer membrane protein